MIELPERHLVLPSGVQSPKLIHHANNLGIAGVSGVELTLTTTELITFPEHPNNNHVLRTEKGTSKELWPSQDLEAQLKMARFPLSIYGSWSIYRVWKKGQPFKPVDLKKLAGEQEEILDPEDDGRKLTVHPLNTRQRVFDDVNAAHVEIWGARKGQFEVISRISMEESEHALGSTTLARFLSLWLPFIEMDPAAFRWYYKPEETDQPEAA